MSILTPAEMREFAPTNLSDDALQIYLDAAEADITAQIGPVSGVVERVTTDTAYIFPARQVASVVSITERVGTVTTTLAANDYYVWPGGYVVERLVGGTNARGHWTGTVTLTYAPVSDLDIRKRVQIALVLLDLEHKPGLTGRSIGEYSEQYANNSVTNYATSKANILSTLPRGVVFA